MAALRIGTCGWNYSHWRRLFYPDKLPQSRWLEFYASAFDTVEINATFYRLPKPEYVDGWRLAVPDNFLFSVKGSRYLTHVKRLGASGEPVDRFLDLIGRLRQKAGPVLWQLPPNFKRNDDRLAAYVGDLPGGWRHTFEFRHPSWFNSEVYDILERAGAGLCISDHPQLPSDQVLTAGWSYIRFHYGAEDGNYSRRQLEDWAGRIHDLARAEADVYAYFNNDWMGYAIENAKQLNDLLNLG